MRLPLASVTLPGVVTWPLELVRETPLSESSPIGARSTPACVISVALILRLPPAESGVGGVAGESA